MKCCSAVQLLSGVSLLTSGIVCSIEKVFIFFYPELKETRYRHMNYTGEVDVGQARVAEGTLSFLYSKSRVEYNIALKYKNANGVPSICNVNDDFDFSLVTVLVPQGFPLKPKYDKVLLAFLEAGLVNWWWEQLKYTASLEGARKFGSPPGEYIVLTLKHLQSAFYFLLIGYAMSVLFFLMELSHHHHKRYKLKVKDTETENRPSIRQPHVSVSGQYCRLKCRHNQDVPICLMSVAGDILM